MSVIIRLQNLPLSANAANIRSFFQGLKIPDGGVNIVGGEDGDAFIAFATDDDARKAMLLNNQPINGVNIRLLLSSKHEMQTIITEAQNRVLKRTVVPHTNNTPQLPAEKRSYTLYNPNSKPQSDSYDTSMGNKMRIIDYSSSANSEPPRPSEFSYRTSKPVLPHDIHIPNNDKVNVYNYDNCDYNYGNAYGHYENFPPHNYDNENYDYSFPNDNYDEPRSNYDDYFEPNDFYDMPDQINRKSLLPTPPVDGNKRKHLPRPLNRYHDYTNRPPWLEESMMMSQSSAVRITLPFSMISEQTVLEIFKNFSLNSKRGVKIEIDCEKRPTGYIYVMFSNGLEAIKALKLNTKSFRGNILNIESISEFDFGKVSDTPDGSVSQLEMPFSQRSPYYRDFCLEIINISPEVNEKDVKDFLNVSMDNKRINFIEKENQTCCLINTLDERMMLKILSFNGAIFRFNSIKVIAISKNQLKAFITTNKNKKESSVPNPLLAARKYLAASSKNDLSCAKFEKLKDETTVQDLSQLFSATIIPLNHIIINNNEAVVDFISAATCQKIIKDLKSRSNIEFTVTPITNSEFQTLKSKFLNNSNGRKPVTIGVNKTPSNTSKTPRSSQVKIRNLPPTVANPQIKDLLRDFEFQPISIQICYANGRHTGEAVLTFRNGLEGVKFKDEFHGKTFLQRELEVLLTDRN